MVVKWCWLKWCVSELMVIVVWNSIIVEMKKFYISIWLLLVFYDGVMCLSMVFRLNNVVVNMIGIRVLKWFS